MADPQPTPPIPSCNFPTMRNETSVSDLSCSPLPILCQIPGMDLYFLPEEKERQVQVGSKPRQKAAAESNPLPVASLPPFLTRAPLPGAQTG